jgi:Fe-S-cluster containining protein
VPPFVTVSLAERDLLWERRPDLIFDADPTSLAHMQLRAGPCPCYDPAVGCTVYDIRPYNCRRYASLKGYTGSARDGQRVRVLFQRKAQRWADRHGWAP